MNLLTEGHEGRFYAPEYLVQKYGKENAKRIEAGIDDMDMNAWDRYTGMESAEEVEDYIADIKDMLSINEVENEMPIGNRELPMGEMKTKTVPNPNKGSWRVVNADTDQPFDFSAFYKTEKEARDAAAELKATKGSGVKIVQLKDTMKVYTKESVGNPTPEQMDILADIQDMVMDGDTDAPAEILELLQRSLKYAEVLAAVQDMEDAGDISARQKLMKLIKQKMQAEWGDSVDEATSQDNASGSSKLKQSSKDVTVTASIKKGTPIDTTKIQQYVNELTALIQRHVDKAK
jgi:hypothetical protein